MSSGLTLIFAGLLTFFGILVAAIDVSVPAIEAELVDSASAALEARNLPFAEVEADGRDLIVTGEAPSDEARQEVIRIVASTWGHRVVWDRMTVATQPPAPTAPPPPPALASEEVARRACQEAVTLMLTEQQVAFELGSARLQPQSAALLDQIANALAGCPESPIHVEGHTDSAGPESYNLRLSKNRAQAVLRALAVRGVARGRMTAIGYGEERPIADNDHREGRIRNRRIELRMLRKD